MEINEDALLNEISHMDNHNKIMDGVLNDQKKKLAEELLSGVGEQMKQDIENLTTPKKKSFLERIREIFA